MPKRKPERKTKKERRGRGEGAIWRRPDGTWRGQIAQGGSGKFRKRVNYEGETKAEVVDAMARGRSNQVDGLLPEPSAITVDQYVTHWLATIRGTVADSSADNYSRVLAKHVSPIIGHLKLQRLAPAHVEAVLNKILTMPMRRYVLIVLSHAMRHAAGQNLIAVNPCGKIQRPKKTQHEIHPWTRDEAAKFLKAIDGLKHEPLYVLAIGTGARQGELLALKWDDVDLKSGSLTVRRTLSTGAGKTVARDPKTKASRRQIKLDARSIEALKEQRKLSMRSGGAGHPWIFCDAAGRWHTGTVISREFRRLLLRKKLKLIRFHDLRHTHATLLLLAGVNPKIVSERLGHASIAITLDIYSHVLPTMQDDAVAKFDRLLG